MIVQSLLEYQTKSETAANNHEMPDLLLTENECISGGISDHRDTNFSLRNCRNLDEFLTYNCLLFYNKKANFETLKCCLELHYWRCGYITSSIFHSIYLWTREIEQIFVQALE